MELVATGFLLGLGFISAFITTWVVLAIAFGLIALACHLAFGD